ncbi:MAG: hypothetical protein IPK72_21045 [Candidatus Eisenbacteria bacterium]|jgi:hypothetical protein|nr:hypothetical protein [Candidatus Eisenbacteria bacterium]
MRRTIRPEDVTRLHALRQRIERWRVQREKRTRMPQALWDDAVACARVHGVWETSQVLAIGYASLRERLTEGSPSKSSVCGGFVELAPLPIAGDGDAQARLVVEVHRRDGSRLSVQLPSNARAEIVTLVERFLGSER